jgi:hypothetical protein
MTAPSRIRLRVAPRAPQGPLLGLVFVGHVGLAAVLLAWVPRGEPPAASRRAPLIEPTVERLLLVAPAPIPAPPTPSTRRQASRSRAARTSQPTAPTVAPAATAVRTRDTAPPADVPAWANRSDDPTALRGVRPHFGDRRLWAPAESRRPSEAPATPQSVIDEALAPVVDSVLQERRSAGRAVSDWTATDRRGRSWGLAPSGLRLGPVGLAIQPPELTDRERAQLAARADIARFRHMTPGDAGFDSLKADLRRQRDQARQQRVPPV